jgi:hypothetical protein
MTFPPFTLGSILAILVFLLAILLAVGVLPFTATIVGVLLCLLAAARLT